MNLLKKVEKFINSRLERYKFKRSRVKTIRLLTEKKLALIRHYVSEIENDDIFLNEIRKRLKESFIYNPSRRDFSFNKKGGSVFFPFVTLYVLIRLLISDIVVETGGTPGKSSCFILRAMEMNNIGKLFTIDLPPAKVGPKKSLKIDKCHAVLPEGEDAGWLIPQWLRRRHTLLKGTSKVHLPALLKNCGNIDIFIHDSDHSYENMLWEFKTAWPSIKKQGLLIADDISSHSAFQDFYKSVKGSIFFIANYGIIKKE